MNNPQIPAEKKKPRQYTLVDNISGNKISPPPKRINNISSNNRATNMEKGGKPERDRNGKFLSGHKGINRHADLRHKATKIKSAIMEAFEKAGGIEEFVKWGLDPKNKKDFYKLVCNILPKDMSIEGEGLNQTKIILVRPKDDTDK